MTQAEYKQKVMALLNKNKIENDEEAKILASYEYINGMGVLNSGRIMLLIRALTGLDFKDNFELGFYIYKNATDIEKIYLVAYDPMIEAVCQTMEEANERANSTED